MRLSRPARKPITRATTLARDMRAVVELELEEGRVAGFSSASPAKTDDDNQDAAAVLPMGAGRAVLALADGLGGHPGGRRAAQVALASLEAALAEADRDEVSVREAILAGFDRANAAVVASGTGGGTTMIVAEIDGADVRTYHVGDSGALLFGARGRLRLQTKAHSPVGYALEAGLIDEQQALVHEDRHIVSNVIGDASMTVELGARLRMRRRDTLVLASDGLFDNLATAEIVAMLRCGPLARAAQAVVDECRRRMESTGTALSKPDDLTLLAYRWEPAAEQAEARSE